MDNCATFKDGLVEQILYMYYVEHFGLDAIANETHHAPKKIGSFIKSIGLPLINSKTKITKSDETAIVRMYTELNMSTRDIRDAIGLSFGAVNNIINRAGVTRTVRESKLIKSIATRELIKQIRDECNIEEDNIVHLKSRDDKITTSHPLYDVVFSDTSLKALYGVNFNKRVKTWVNCKQCGTSFEIYTYRILPDGNFCKPACSNKWMSEHQIGENNPNWKGGKVTVHCNTCGSELQRDPNEIKDGKVYFCNNVCEGKYKSERNIKENNPNWDGGMVKVQCSYCGAELERALNKVNDSNIYWCNKDCESKWKHIHWKGENCPAFQNGSSFLPYCKKFNRDFKLSVRIYWDHTCAICGTHEDNLSSALSVHHVHRDKESLCAEDSPRMFVPLCKKCHGKVHGKRNSKYYEQMFESMIREKEGKCYCTPEEVLEYLSNNS